MQAVQDPIPVPKGGFLKKLSRSKSFTTFISNWQKRYFTLVKGKIVYYETVANDGTPINAKGDMKLINSSIQMSNIGERQIKILGAHGEYDLLVETATDSEHKSWCDAIREHIIYATNQNWTEREYLVDLIYITGKKVDINQETNWSQYVVTLSDGWISGKGYVESSLEEGRESISSPSADVEDKPFFDINLSKCEMPFVDILDEKNDEKKVSMANILIVSADCSLKIKTKLENVHVWCVILKTEMKLSNNKILKPNNYVGQSLDDMFANLSLLHTESDVSDAPSQPPSAKDVKKIQPLYPITPPPMTIAIMVCGTRGDVQPFIYFGQALQRKGHRVRLATHAEYRDDVVKKGGLEFYPLAGDPKKLSEYMVKTGGRLMPDLTNMEEMSVLPEKMKALEDIIYSCYPACTAVDPMDEEKKPFLADAIVSNPVTYGHIHVAEALCVPLHIMFPQPWSPTKCFPHPLSNNSYDVSWSNWNYATYALVDEFFFLGFGNVFNQFRKNVLKISPIRIGDRGRSLLNDNQVPITHMWSPSFVPKCIDWPEYVDVAGEFRLTGSDVVVCNYKPEQPLADFLAAGEKPIYIGFGSMVMEEADVANLVKSIKEAQAIVKCRILLQSGWTKYAENYEEIAPGIMVIGAMPHDFLFYEVCGVVHHGGAGTTSAGLRGGNPTFICPFFGDQHFWAAMISRAGAGPKGCPIKMVTTEKFVEAFQVMRKPETLRNAKLLADKMALEDGVATGLESFYRNLPKYDLICEVSAFNKRSTKIARIYCSDCCLKMCEEVDAIIHREITGRQNHVRAPYRPSVWGRVTDTISAGLRQGITGAAHEIAGGVYDLFAQPVKGAYNKGALGMVEGTATGVINLVARPMKGGKILVKRVIEGASNKIAEYNNIHQKKLDRTAPSNKSSIFSRLSMNATTTNSTPSSPSITSESVELSERPEMMRNGSVQIESNSTEILCMDLFSSTEDLYELATGVLELWKQLDEKGVDFFRTETNLHPYLPNVANANELREILFLQLSAEPKFNMSFAEFAWFTSCLIVLDE